MIRIGSFFLLQQINNIYFLEISSLFVVKNYSGNPLRYQILINKIFYWYYNISFLLLFLSAHSIREPLKNCMSFCIIIIPHRVLTWLWHTETLKFFGELFSTLISYFGLHTSHKTCFLLIFKHIFFLRLNQPFQIVSLYFPSKVIIIDMMVFERWF